MRRLDASLVWLLLQQQYALVACYNLTAMHEKERLHDSFHSRFHSLNTTAARHVRGWAVFHNPPSMPDLGAGAGAGAVRSSRENARSHPGRGGLQVTVMLVVLLALAWMAVRGPRSMVLLSQLPDSLRSCWRTRRLTMIVAAWFASSVVTEVADSIVMRQLKAPLTLALWKFVISMPCGAAAILASGQPLPTFPAYFQVHSSQELTCPSSDLP